MKKPNFNKWKTLTSEDLFSSGFVKMRRESCELPDGRVMPRYFIMDFPDWVNIFPVTSEGKILLIRQYRHPSQKVHIELPGGSTEPKLSESPQQAAERELLEETGYRGNEVINLGYHYPNPALQSNRMHTFLILGCEKVAEPQWDEFEELENFIVTQEQLDQLILSGDLDHSVMMASLMQGLTALKARNL